MRSTATTSALLAKPFLHILQPHQNRIADPQSTSPTNTQRRHGSAPKPSQFPQWHCAVHSNHKDLISAGAQIQNISQHSYWAYPVVYTHLWMSGINNFSAAKGGRWWVTHIWFLCKGSELQSLNLEPANDSWAFARKILYRTVLGGPGKAPLNCSWEDGFALVVRSWHAWLPESTSCS